MPNHLEQVNIEAPGILETLCLWLSNNENQFTPSTAESNLEKCTAKELDKEIEPLWNNAVTKLYKDVSIYISLYDTY